MAKKLSVDLGLNATGYTQGASQVVYQTKQMTQSVQEYVSQNGNLTKQLREAKREAQNLAVQFNDLSAAEKNSEYGQNIAAQLDFAMRKAAELQDVFSDTNSAIKNLASDTATFDALSQGFSAIGSAVTGVLGTIGTLTGKQEDMNRAISAYVAIENTAQAAIKIKNMLQKQSSLMLGIQTLQTRAAAAAENLKTKSTIAATVAQKAFNLVAKANPYVLLATAVIAVGGALAGFAINAKKATEEEKRAAQEAEELRAAQERLREEQTKITQAGAETRVEFLKLQQQWSLLKTDAEKTQWIENNQAAFKSLGLSIIDAKDAERVFVKYSDVICAALVRRSIAAAKAAAAYQRIIELEGQKKTGYKWHVSSAGETFKSSSIPKEFSAAGLTRDDYSVTDSYNGSGSVAQQIYKVNASGAKKLTTYYKAQAKKDAEDFNRGIDAAIKREEQKALSHEKSAMNETATIAKFGGFNSRGSSTGSGGTRSTGPRSTGNKTGSTSNTPKPTPTKTEPNTQQTPKPGSLTDLNKQLSDLNTQLEDGEIEVDKFIEKRDELLEKINNKRVELGLEKIPTQLMKLREELQVIKSSNEDGIFVNSTLEKDKERIKELEKLIEDEEIKLGLKPVIEKGSQAEIDAKIQELTEKQVNLTIGSDEWKKLQDEIDKQNKLKVNLEASVKSDEIEKNLRNIFDTALADEPRTLDFSNLSANEQKIAEDVQNRIDKIKEARTQLQEIMSNPSEHSDAEIESATEKYNTLGEVLKDQIDIQTKFAEKNAELGEQNQNVEQLTSAYNSIGSIGSDAFNLITQASNKGILSLDEQTKGWLNFGSTLISTIAKTIPALFAGTFAEGAKNAFAQPFPLNLAAWATTSAAILAIFSSLPKFAEGGIIGGNSFNGDKLLARVNSGEMILNQRQQRNLFNFVNNPNSGNSIGATTVKVRGADLYLALNNYEKINHKK